MTGLLIAVLIEVPAVAAVSLWLIHLMLRTHAEVTGAVIGRRARDVRTALEQAERRIIQAARGGLVARAGRGGLVARAGPGRLKD